MQFDITVETKLEDSYRSNRARSLYNVDVAQASSHRVQVDLPLDDKPWRVGAIIGPSGTGKTTLGKKVLGDEAYHKGFDWPDRQPVLDAISPSASFEDVTAALSAVGLGTVPSWLRPFHVLSGGERFRADLARALIETKGDIVLDEFTSVVDRQVAQIGAAAFSKAWRRKPEGRVVVLSCHYDIVEWLQPDWVLDTREWQFGWRSVQRPPSIAVDILRTDWGPWRFFEPHHYLKLPRMIAAYNYVAQIGDTPVAHVAVSMFSGARTARLCRLVVMPEWQGAGVGMRFLEKVAQFWLDGENPYKKKMTGIIHTSHPGLVAALNRSKRWVCVSQQMGGEDRNRSLKTMLNTIRKGGKVAAAGYGGHLRAVAAFRYVGDR